MPDPDKPINTQISPGSTLRFAPGDADDLAGRRYDLVPRPTLVEKRKGRLRRCAAEHDVDVLKLDGGHQAGRPVVAGRRKVRSSRMVTSTIARPASNPMAGLT